MSLYYRCKDGDLLDEICHHYYGKTHGAVEQVLVANPGLAKLGASLPVGTLVLLPDDVDADKQEVNPWQ
ncbi:MAG: tail protein X [Gammaproteobacteria bacterium]|nr:tail protein X [Gammaproteobacteria bacterium]MDH5651689.1 tail protein X [Gammaproteobacteria bacterium]